MHEAHPPYALTNFSLLTGEERPSSMDVNAILVNGNRIDSLCDERDIPPQISRIDLQGNYLSPGFIDLQLNGCGGVTFNNDISGKTLDIMHRANLHSGCTTFLPTLITCSDEDIIKAVKTIHNYRLKHPERTPGIHLEGPYINRVRKGIHDGRHIRPPSDNMLDYLCQHASDIAMITLAPKSAHRE